MTFDPPATFQAGSIPAASNEWSPWTAEDPDEISKRGSAVAPAAVLYVTPFDPATMYAYQPPGPAPSAAPAGQYWPPPDGGITEWQYGTALFYAPRGMNGLPQDVQKGDQASFWSEGGDQVSLLNEGDKEPRSREATFVKIVLLGLALTALILILIVTITFMVSSVYDEGTTTSVVLTITKAEEKTASDVVLPPHSVKPPLDSTSRTIVQVSGKTESTPMITTWAATSTTTNTTSNSTSTKPTTTTTKAVLCTVGYTLYREEPITEGMCDYALYTHLAAIWGALKPVGGDVSWKIFKEAVRKSRKTVGGVSFSSLHPEHANGTLTRLEVMQNQMNDVVRRDGMRALGALGLDADFALLPNSLEATFTLFKRALEGLPLSMTFLGLYLYTSSDANAFVRAASNWTNVDYVIVQTHIVRSVGHVPCKVYLISKGYEDKDVPSLETANTALQGLRKRRFRVLLSSTMAVVAYVGPSPETCERSIVADIDIVCSETVNNSRSVYYKEDMSEFVTFSANSRYTFAFESERSLSKKVKKYRNLTDGWAFFDIQRDVYWPCSNGRAYGRIKEGVKALRQP